MEIATALNGGNLNYETLYNVKDGNGNTPFVIVPASIAQTGTYSKEMYLNGKVHFAFDFDIGQGYCGINYNILDVSSHVNSHHSWGLAGTFDYAYPSLASYGVDSTDSSFMVCFVRSGATIYPQVCVVNFDGTWSPNSKIVHNGLGPVDISVTNLERWGDRTGICRRYNAVNPGNWLSGHYGTGPLTNQYGLDSCWSTWVAEIGDGPSIGMEGVAGGEELSMLVYPNPAYDHVTIQLMEYKAKGHSLELVDLTGRVLFRETLPSMLSLNQQVVLYRKHLKLAAGTYFVRIHENPRYHEKVVFVD